MATADAVVTEGYLVLEPIKHNGKRYPQYATLPKTEMDEVSAEALILAGVVEVAEWVEDSLPDDPEPPVVETKPVETQAAPVDNAETAIKPPKPSKPAKPAKASQE